ncbi:MAG: hypothetical protein AB9856_20965 [Cellulosilyticaceae bacterium]
MKSMSLTKYFEIKKPVYETLQIIPHSGIRNYNSSSIAKMVSDMYMSITKNIHKIEKKLIVETTVKCSYMIDIRRDSVSFYFVVPRQYKSIAKDKITSVWPQATIEEGREIEQFKHDTVTTYQLAYKKLDGLSLSVDKKSNTSLNHILNVIDIMESDDRIAVIYNFIPTQQKGWNNKCRHDLEKYENNEPIVKEFGAEHILKGILNGVCTVINSILDAMGSEISKGSPLDQLSQYFKINKLELSEATKKKRFDTVIGTQVVVASGSQDNERATSNAISVCQSYRALEGDNELIYKKVPSKNINLLDTKFKGIEIIKVGANECHNFLQLPGRDLLMEHNIEHVNVLESKVNEELLKGYVRAGKSTYKGNTVQTYFSPDKEIANLPFIMLGPMGAGKTFQNVEYAKDVIASGEGLVVIDYIKNNELADSIKAIAPKDKLLEINLGIESNLQAFAYNEYKLQGNTPFEHIESANLHQQQVTALIDAVYIGDSLSGQMRKFFTSAADIVLINENMSLRDVIQCLENHEVRTDFIKKIPKEYMEYLEDQVATLKQLDEVKAVKTNTGEKDENGKDIIVSEDIVVGTKYVKIEHIMDRVNSLREDIRMRMMFNKPATGNVDFSEAMNQGKIILIKMPADKFRSQHARNVLTTFFISKVWLACNIRGVQQDKLLRYHMLLDEIFQAPTAYKPLANILRECRKFQLRLVFTAHQFADLGELQTGLKSAGASYMLLQKTDKANFKYLEQEFSQYGFTVDDLLSLKRYHSLSLISYSGGNCAYVSDLEV